MSNRTDWPELAEEIIDRLLASGAILGPVATDLKVDLLSEFHNAFVAGQESSVNTKDIKKKLWWILYDWDGRLMHMKARE